MSLLEVLVAFVIAALALGTVVDGTVGGVRAAGAASRTEEALARARSRLAAATARPVPGESAGDDGGGFQWRLSVKPANTAVRDNGPVLLSVSVSVSWAGSSGSKQVMVQTERLATRVAP